MINCKVSKLDFYTEHTFKLSLDRNGIKFKSGQCFSLGIPRLGINREYSIYSGEKDAKLEFLIRIVEGGIISNALSELHVGDIVEVNGPFGDFTIKDENLYKNHLFVASGTGIAPFRSFVRSYPLLNYEIFHGVRYENELYDKDNYKNHIACISQSESLNKRTRVTDQLNKCNTEFDVIYICGNQHMIYDSQDIIFKKYAKIPLIYTETFF